MQLPDLAQYVRSLPDVCAGAPEGHLAMLEAHYRAVRRRITATDLAAAAGYSSYGAANLQYGIFAHKLCDAMSFAPPVGNSGEPTYTYVLAASSKLQNLDWEWTMHPVVAQAIELSGLFGGAVPAVEMGTIYPDEVPEDERYIEGATQQRTVNAHERSRAARTACLEYWGTTCSVCEIDFDTTYGAESARCIHVHHLEPLAALRSQHVVNPVDDLRPVCPNCHTVLHTVEPPLSVSELRTRLRARKGG